MKQPSYYAFFDVDGTILNFTSMLSFLSFFRKQYHTNWLSKSIAEYSYLFKCKFLYVNHDRNFLNRLYYTNYKDKDVKNIETLGKQWFAQRVLQKTDALNLDVVKTLKEHQRKGACIVLVSGAFKACIKPIADYLRVDNILCVKPAEKNGKYTGEIKGIQTIGLGKLEAISNFLSEQQVDQTVLDNAYAYGDHISDIPMLRMVANPCVVKSADADLLDYAKNHRWTII